MDDTEKLDKAVRHYIYQTFAETAKPPTTEAVARYQKRDIVSIEQSFRRLADAHHVALAPGSSAIWMAHPFSALPTNHTAESGSKTYFAN